MLPRRRVLRRPDVLRHGLRADVRPQLPPFALNPRSFVHKKPCAVFSYALACRGCRFLWLYSHCYNIITGQNAQSVTAFQSLAGKCRAAEIDEKNGLPCTPRRHDSIAGTWAGTALPDSTGDLDGEGFCFGATSADTVVETFASTYTGSGGSSGLGAHTFSDTGWCVHDATASLRKALRR